MTTTNPPIPAAFTSDDFAVRMSRVASSAAEKGLAGVIVTPGSGFGLAHRVPSDGDH